MGLKLKKRKRDNGGPRCVHCNVRKASQSRNLCYVCFQEPEVRDLYPPKGKMTLPDGSPTTEVDFFKAQPTEVPTETEPGSQDRIAVYMERVLLKQDLHHPKDVGCFHEESEVPVRMVKVLVNGKPFRVKDLYQV